MSLISIAQKETFHISFVQFANKDYKADLLTPESYKKTIGNRDYYNAPAIKNRRLRNGGNYNDRKKS